MRNPGARAVLVAVACILCCPCLVSAQDGGYLFITKWGGTGTADGKFNGPRGIAASHSDSFVYLYVTDYFNNRVQDFRDSGEFVRKWGAWGSDPSQFKGPTGVAANDSGSVYVADFMNHRVQRFTTSGIFHSQYGSEGGANGKLRYPRDVDALKWSPWHTFVADFANNRIQEFDVDNNYVAKWGGPGTGESEFQGPCGIAVLDVGGSVMAVYVVDQDNHRVQRFDGDYDFVREWGGLGDGGGQFNTPGGIDLDQYGLVYVADTGNNRVQKFNHSGVHICSWGSYGTGDYEFDSPTDIAVDNNDFVYVVDHGNDYIKKYRPNWRPTIPTDCIISPENPGTMDDLHATAYGSMDPDDDPIEYVYHWRSKAGELGVWGPWGGPFPSPYQDPVVDHDRTSRGNYWQARAKAADEVSESEDWRYSSAVVILNTPPEITGVTITPAIATTHDDLTAGPSGWHDDDDDPEGYVWEWGKQNADGTWSTLAGETTSTLGHEHFEGGDRIGVACTPSDGENTGGTQQAEVTILGVPELTWLNTHGYMGDGVFPNRDRHLEWFTFKVKYTGAPPSRMRMRLYRYGVEVAGSPFDMNPGGGDPPTGQTFWYKRRLCKGTYTYTFRACDGYDIAVGAPTNDHTGPVVHNRPPRLVWVGSGNFVHDGLHPQGRVMPGTEITWKIKYIDREFDPAQYVRAHVARLQGGEYREIDGSPFDTVHQRDDPDGSVYRVTRTLNTEGRYAVWFSARENAAAPFTSHDAYGVPTWWHRRMLWVFNQPPELRWAPGAEFRGDTPPDGVDPNSGNAGDTFTFRVQYRDAEGIEPAYVRLHLLRWNGSDYVEVGASPFEMSTTDTTFDIANYSVAVQRNQPARYRYQFSANDGLKDAIGEPSWHRMPGPTVNAAHSVSAQVKSLSCCLTAAGAQVTFVLSSDASVTAEVLNIAGRRVAVLVNDRPLPAGANTLTWNGRSAAGVAVPSGVYLVRVEAIDDAGSKSCELGWVSISR